MEKKKRKIIVTGSEGFIGKQLCKRLNDLGYEIIPVDLKIGIDVCDIDVKDADIVYHLAASTSVFNEDKESIIHNNIKAFIHISDECVKHGVKMIYASSSCALKCNCTSLYCITKSFNEEYAR